MTSFEILGEAKMDNLIADSSVPLLTTAIVLVEGQGLLKRGSVIGIASKILGTPEADAENTGNGVISAVSLGAGGLLGSYKLVCTAAAVDGGTFAVYDPDGNRMEDATVGVAYVSQQINFTVNDGTTDFIVGDQFLIPVTKGTKGMICNKVAVDGSSTAEFVLSYDVDTTDADVTAVCYKTGCFTSNVLFFGGESTADDHANQLKNVGIFLKDEYQL